MPITFDATYYINNNADIAAAIRQGKLVATTDLNGDGKIDNADAALQHFNQFGWTEGRNPNAVFNTTYYLQSNPDVNLANVNPLTHYLKFGINEAGRAENASMAGVNATTFDSATYNTSNPDLAKAGLTTAAQLFQHYIQWGQFETGRGVISATINGVKTAINPTGGSGSGGNTNPATTFSLTTSIDNVTSSFNTVNAVIDQNTATNTTWSLSDTVAPAGSSTLNLTLIGAAGANAALAGFATTGVTTLNIKPINAGATVTNSFDLASISGVTVVNVINANATTNTSGTLTLANLAATTALGFSNNTVNESVTATWASAALSGTNPTVNLAFNGGVDGNAISIGTGFVTANIATLGTGNKVTTLNFNSGGGTDKLTTVKVSGTGNFNVTNVLDSTITSFDASGNSGAVVVNLAGASALNAKGGTGSSDVLTLTTGSTLGTGVVVSGFETIYALDNGSGNITIDTTSFTGATKLGLAAGGSASYAVTFSNIAAALSSASFSGTDTTGSGSTTFNGLTWGLKTATGTSDALTLAFDNGGVATTGTLTTGAISALGIENLTITTADAKAVTLGGITESGSTNANVTITGSGASNLTLGGVSLTNASATANDVLTFTGLTGKLTVGAITDTSGVTFTGGAGDTTLTVGATGSGWTSTYTMGNGTNTITLTDNNSAGTTTVTGGTGGDTFQATLGTGAAYTTVGSGAINLDGGTGANLLTVTLTAWTGGAAAGSVLNIASLKNVATINVLGTAESVGSGKADTINITTPTNYADTLTINQLAAASAGTNSGVAVNFKTATAGTMDLTNVTLQGTTSLGGTNGGGLFATGSTGNDIITASKSTSMTISAGGGVDTINLIASASRVGTVVDTINQASGNTGIFAQQGSNTISTSAYDIISNAKHGTDTIQIASPGTVVTTVNTSNTLATVTLADQSVTAIRGNYSSGTFVGSGTGADLMVAYDADGTGGTSFQAVVVTGITSVSVSASGLITL